MSKLNKNRSNTKKTILHVGCGLNKYPGAIGVDINPHLGADVVHDLNVFPYPFRANQFELIIAEHIIEHLDEIISVMEELHRIAKPGARIKITSPHFSSVDSFTDLTHKHFLTSRSFDYFVVGADLAKFHYSPARFTIKKIWLGPLYKVHPLLFALLKLINKYRLVYESRFAYIFPVGSIYYELKVVK